MKKSTRLTVLLRSIEQSKIEVKDLLLSRDHTSTLHVVT